MPIDAGVCRKRARLFEVCRGMLIYGHAPLGPASLHQTARMTFVRRDPRMHVHGAIGAYSAVGGAQPIESDRSLC